MKPVYRASEKYKGVFISTEMTTKRGATLRPELGVFGLVPAEVESRVYVSGKNTVHIKPIWIGWTRGDVVVSDDTISGWHGVLSEADVLNTFPVSDEPDTTSRT